MSARHTPFHTAPIVAALTAFAAAAPAQANGEQVLYSFTGGSDGNHPYAGVVRDSGGNLYGVTANGGENRYGAISS